MRATPPPRIADKGLSKWAEQVYNSLINVTVSLGSWQQVNVSASQSNVDLNLLGSSTNLFLVVPFAGNIVSMSLASNAARSGGTLTVKPTINGAESTTLSAVLNAATTTTTYSVQVPDGDAFFAGDLIGVSVTTDGSWAPTTADIVVTLFIKTGVSS